jgi:hypothetical protein
MRVITTSTPTPRPDTPLITAAVLKPERERIRSNWSSASDSAAASTRPSAFAFARIFARSMPRPSSATRIATLFRSRGASQASFGWPSSRGPGGLDAVIDPHR